MKILYPLGLLAGVALVTVVAVKTSKKRADGPATPPERAPTPTAPPTGQEGSSGPMRPPGPKPEAKPFYLMPEATGDVVHIEDLKALLPWVLDKAKELKVGKFTGIASALDKIAKDTSHKKILGIVVKQLPELGQIKWGDVKKLAGKIPWTAIGPMAKAWLATKGLG